MEINSGNVVEKNPVPKSQTKPFYIGTKEAPSELGALFLNYLIISPFCLVWVRAQHCPHVRQAKFCSQVCELVFLGVLPFLPIGPSRTS